MSKYQWQAKRRSNLTFFVWLKRFSQWRSFLVIMVVASLGIAATQALFRDVEKSQQGTFVVGTLDLTLEEENGAQVAQNITVTKIGSQKTLAGEKTWKIHNQGSLDGDLAFKLANVQNLENGCNEPESLVDSTCDNPGDGEGELGSELIFQVIVGQGNQARTLVTSDLSPAHVDQFEQQWNQANPPIKVKAGQTLDVTLKWHNKENSLGNEVQSDSLQFDVIYELEQIVNQ